MSTTGSSFDGFTPRTRTFIMAKKFMSLLAALAVIGGAAPLFAQEGAKPAFGEGESLK
jgi:hypothetical protein